MNQEPPVLLRLLYSEIEQPDPCAVTLAKAAEYYQKPLSALKLKAPLEKLYEVADTDEPIGQWVTSVPRPGDVAGCIRKQQKKKYHGIF